MCVFDYRWVGKLCVPSIHPWSLSSYTESSHSTSSWLNSVLYQSGNPAVKMRPISTEQVGIWMENTHNVISRDVLYASVHCECVSFQKLIYWRVLRTTLLLCCRVLDLRWTWRVIVWRTVYTASCFTFVTSCGVFAPRPILLMAAQTGRKPR